MVILTDTNIIIDYLRQKQKENTTFHKLFIEAVNISAISLITVSELWQGESMNNSNNIHVVEELLKKLEVVLSNVETAKLTGELLRNKAYNLNFTDAGIASCALYYNLPLLTKNTKDFKKIKGLKLFDY